MAQDIVSAHFSKNVKIALDLKGDAITPSHSELPNSCHPLHLLNLERRMPRVGKKLMKLLINLLLDFLREALVIPMKPFGRKQFHRLCFLKNCFISLTLRKGPWTRPFRISSSASRSPTCHSLVQK